MRWLLPLLIALIAVPASAAQGIPEQVHASAYDGGLGIAWARAGDVGADVEDGVRWWAGNETGHVPAFGSEFIAPGTTVFSAKLPTPEGDVLRYQVGSDRYGWSEEQELRLRPADGVWRFTAFGDHGSGGDSNVSLALVDRIVEQAPHAVLHLGDLSYANGHAPTWDAWFRMVEPMAASSLYMAAPGNHEHEGYIAGSDPDARWATETDSITDAYHQFTSRFLFSEGEHEDLWYSFDTGPVHVTVFNTEDLCVWQPAQYYVPWRFNPTCDFVEDDQDTGGVERPGVPGATTPPHQPLVDWVRADLEANQDAAWNIVIFHQPAYSAGAYDGRIVLQEHFVPLFEEYGVDLVLAGHDHNYQRSYPLRQHVPATGALDGYAQGEAPVYIVSGGGGDGVYGLDEPKPDWTAARNASYHYVLLDVTEDALRVQAIETRTGALLDTFTIGNATRFAEPMAPEPVADRDTPVPWTLAVVVFGLALLRKRS